MERHLSFRVPEGLVAALEARAASEDRPVSWIIRRALEVFLEVEGGETGSWSAGRTDRPVPVRDTGGSGHGDLVPVPDARSEVDRLARRSIAEENKRAAAVVAKYASPAAEPCKHPNKKVTPYGLKSCEECGETWR